MAIRSNDALRASNKNQSDPGRSSDLPEADLSNDKATAGRRRRARRWLSCALSAGALGLFLSSVPGCTTTSGLAGAIGDGGCVDDFMIGYRNRALAEKAWHCQKGQFCNQQHSKEFKEGFTEGFMEVATGGNGCVPTIAPKQYWGWRYQSAQGQGAVNSWFEGYPMGVRAAEQAGVGNWGNVQTANYQNQTPQAAAPYGGANPFYGNPTAAGQDSNGSPALQAPVMDSETNGAGPVDSGPSDAIEDIIDLDFDSASTTASPQYSGFGNEPVFESASDDRIAELQDAAGNGGVSVDVDEVFGATDSDVTEQFDSSADSLDGDSLPFSFE